jgi:hypothetical protein
MLKTVPHVNALIYGNKNITSQFQIKLTAKKISSLGDAKWLLPKSHQITVHQHNDAQKAYLILEFLPIPIGTSPSARRVAISTSVS